MVTTRHDVRPGAEASGAKPGHAPATPGIAEQQSFWNWHWAHWRERNTINEWKDLRHAAILAHLRAIGLRDARLLELGCGPGHYARSLVQFGKVTAIDLSNDAIEVARSKYPEIVFHAGNLYTFPLPEASFDAVIAQEVFDHVESQPGFIERAWRLLRPDGHLLISCTNRFVIERLAPGTFPKQPDAHIARPLTRPELRDLLEPRFQIVSLDSIIHGVGQRGIYRITERTRVDRMIRKILGASRLARIKGRLGLGYQWIVLARKRNAVPAD
jgi:SAM-dependent methyltransferase